MLWEKEAYSCAEAITDDIQAPKQVRNIFTDPDIQLCNAHDALVCLLNVMTIEARFVPQSSYKSWKKRCFYSILYTHYTTGDIIYQIKYLPSDISKETLIFALVDKRPIAKLSLQHDQYVEDHRENDPKKVYKNVLDLNILYKNAIVWKMLAGAHEYLNMKPMFGLVCLPAEVKLEILYQLRAQELGRLRSVNKEFNELVEDPTIWKCILSRDFPKLTNKREVELKEIYKTEYKKKKDQEKLEKENLKRKERNDRYMMEEHRKRDRWAIPHPTSSHLLASNLEEHFGFRQRPGPSRRHDFASVNLSRF